MQYMTLKAVKSFYHMRRKGKTGAYEYKCLTKTYTHRKWFHFIQKIFEIHFNLW